MSNIPKIIHYCWFGKNEKNNLIKQCISSWKEYLPDYEIIEWNEDNFDINSNDYIKEAYTNKKWAFVTDYVRIYAVYNYGGIYLDTDVEITNNLDTFLSHRAFTGFESKYVPFTALFGAEKNHPWVKKMMEIYDDIAIKDSKGNINLTTNTIHVSKIMIENYNAKINNKYQILKDDLNLYPSNYFCRPSNKNNYAIHHCDGSWITGKKKVVRTIVKQLFGDKISLKIMDAKSNLQFGLGFRKINNKRN